MDYINSLNWRYATKKFNPTRKVDEDVLTRILQSGNLAASSLGLQPIKILNVANPELRNTLLTASFNQSQVIDASHLLVICAESNISENHVSKYIELMASTREIDKTILGGFEKMAKGFVAGFVNEESKMNWASKQAYIVLGTLLTACAIEKVDSCPMEGFNPQAYVEVLNLNELSLYPVLVLPIGYRSVEDANQHLKKVRKPFEEYVISI